MRQAAILALSLALFGQPLQAQSRFDGVWRLAPESTDASGIRYDISLKDGVFTCRWCVGAEAPRPLTPSKLAVGIPITQPPACAPYRL